MKLLHLVAVSICLPTWLAAQAQESGTLQKIRKSGGITLGVSDSAVPFSYPDGKQSYQGYSIDLCLKVGSAIQKQLGLPSLDVKMKEVNSSNRVALLTNGTIDLVCSSATNTRERQKQVAFSYTTFVASHRFLSKKSSAIQSLDDLKGKTIAANIGSSNMAEISALNQEKNLGMKIVGVKAKADGFQMVESGQAAAFIQDDVLLATLAAGSKSPGDYVITRAPLSMQPNALVFRRDDAEFKKIVDATLAGLFKSGEINRLYFKWFQSPIPPNGLSLNWPQSEELKNAIAKPTDSGDPDSYATGTRKAH